MAAQTRQNVYLDWLMKLPQDYRRQIDETDSPSMKYHHSLVVPPPQVDPNLRPRQPRGWYDFGGPGEEMNISLSLEPQFRLPERRVAYPADAIQDHIAAQLAQRFLSQTFVVPEINDRLSTLQALKLGNFSMIQCQSCPSRGVANMYCKLCNSFLCKTCTDNHKSLKCFKTHELLAVEKVVENPRYIFDRQENCSSHPGRELTKYCPTCKIPVCRDCMIVKHRDHRSVIVDISSETDNRLAELKNGVREYDVSSKNIEKNISELRDKRVCLRENAVKIVARTNAHFSELFELLIQKKAHILEDITEQYLRQERAIQDEIDELSRSMDENREVVKRTNKFLESAESMKCLLFKPVFEDFRVVLKRTHNLVKRKQNGDNSQLTVVDEKALDNFLKALMESFSRVHYTC